MSDPGYDNNDLVGICLFYETIEEVILIQMKEIMNYSLIISHFR
jgi:hypothetical protein